MPILQGRPIDTTQVNPISRIMQGVPSIFANAARGAAANNARRNQLSQQYIRDAATDQIRREQVRMQKEKMAMSAYQFAQTMALSERKMEQSARMQNAQLAMQSKVADARLEGYNLQNEKIRSEMESAAKAREAMNSMLGGMAMDMNQSGQTIYPVSESGAVIPDDVNTALGEKPWNPDGFVTRADFERAQDDVETVIQEKRFKDPSRAAVGPGPPIPETTDQIQTRATDEMRYHFNMATNAPTLSKAEYHANAFVKLRSAAQEHARQIAKQNAYADSMYHEMHAGMQPEAFLTKIDVEGLPKNASIDQKYTRMLSSDTGFRAAFLGPAELKRWSGEPDRTISDLNSARQWQRKIVGFNEITANNARMKYGMAGVDATALDAMVDNIKLGGKNASDGLEIVDAEIAERVKHQQYTTTEAFMKDYSSSVSAFLGSAASYNDASRVDYLTRKRYDADKKNKKLGKTAGLRMRQLDTVGAGKARSKKEMMSSYFAMREMVKRKVTAQFRIEDNKGGTKGWYDKIRPEKQELIDEYVNNVVMDIIDRQSRGLLKSDFLKKELGLGKQYKPGDIRPQTKRMKQAIAIGKILGVYPEGGGSESDESLGLGQDNILQFLGALNATSEEADTAFDDSLK